MSRTVWPALLLALSTVPAAAENVRVLSGEHADFSRLVMVFDRATRWRSERTGDGWRVAFDRPEIRLDLSGVFRLIPRDRIEDVRFDPAAPALEIDSSCDCHVDLFEAGRNILAIDVKDGPDPDAPAPAAASRPAPDLPLPILAPDAAAAGPPLPEPAELAAAARPSVLPAQAAPDRRAARPDLASLEADLVEGLGRAASSGLVDVVLPDGAPPPAAEDAAPEAPTVRPDAPADAEQGPAPPGPERQIAVETAFDRERGAARGPAPSAGCLPDSRLDLGDWADADAPLDAIAEARRRVAEADADGRADAVADLARTYLALGFGAEAAATVAASAKPVADGALLRALARILDHGAAQPGSPLAGQHVCPGKAALWGVLAEPAPERLADADAPAVTFAFSQLPAHLRRQLGSGLAARLHMAGHEEAARAVRDATARLPGAVDPGLRHLDAERALSEGAADRAEAALETLIAEGGPMSAQALATLYAARLDRGEALAEDAITLAQAMARENRDTPLGRDLRAIAARGLARAGRVVEAVTLYDEVAATRTPAPDPVYSELVRAIATLPPPDALRAVFAVDLPASAARIDEGAAVELAGRLARLGLPEAADRLLAPHRGSGRAETVLRRAEIALARGDTDRARSILASRDGPEVARLRALAAERDGAHAEAAGLLAEAGLADEAAQAALRSGDPDLILRTGGAAERLAEVIVPAGAGATGQDPAERTPAERRSADPGAAPEVGDPGPSDPPRASAGEDGAVTLAASAARLAESRALREALAEVLATLPAATE